MEKLAARLPEVPAPFVGLDSEEARLDWAAFDLASGVWEFCKDEDGTTLDAPAAAAFAEA